MSGEKAGYGPTRFLDELEGNNHIVLLYDDARYADLVIARYFRNGLEKGESCIFFTPDDPRVMEQRLSSHGIDVDSYKQANLLRVYRIERSDENKHDTLGTLRQIRKQATMGMRPPYRFAGRTITDTETIRGMDMGLSVERTGHDHFEEFECSQMCHYDITKLEPSKKSLWIRDLLKNHHHVIYAAEPDRAVAFDTSLLEDEQ